MDANELQNLSLTLEQAVQRATPAVATVFARRRMPSSGTYYASGLVLTASHTVEQEEGIVVSLNGADPLPAELAGRDPGSDLAVLRVNGGSLPAAETAAGEARIGQLALALGRPDPQAVEASLGIISSIGGPVRTGRGGLLERYLRTDATAFPGFSGGPLVDAHGKVIGVNTSGMGSGLFLSIPVSIAWQTAAVLAEHGQVRRAYLGVRSQMVDLPDQLAESLGREQRTALVIVGVEADSPAARAGLLVGDLLVGIDGEAVQEPDDLLVQLGSDRAGQAARLQLLRGGQLVDVDVTMGVRPPGRRRSR